MVQDHLRPQPDRLLMAKLYGIIWRHARWYEPAQEETDAAVAELYRVRAQLVAEIRAAGDDATAARADELLRRRAVRTPRPSLPARHDLPNRDHP